MRRISKFGATALAMALTLTLVAPITANAEVTWTREKDEGGHWVYTYTNEDTGETKSEKDFKKLDFDDLASETKVFYIGTNSYDEYKVFDTTVDVAKFEGFKSNKKALKVKVIGKEEYTDPDKDSADYDYHDKDNYYYRNVNGTVVKVAKDSPDVIKDKSSGWYKVRFFTKKAGTYKVSYTAVLKNGTTVKKTIKIIAREDGTPIKEITFAGKVIDQSVDLSEPSKNRLWGKGYGYNVTSAKSGKIKVTVNKDFKLKKIEVGTPVIESITSEDGTNTYKKYKDATSSNEAINFDGYYTWKTVKNGKKIKLNKIDTAEVVDFDFEGYDPKTTTYFNKNTSTATPIRVTIFNKKNKTTKRYVYWIQKVQK